MATREQQIVKIGLLGILMNVFLAVLKGLVGFFTGSLAISLDALNNSTDVLSSTVTIAGAKLAARAPDKRHPHGHKHLEDLAAFIIGLIILTAGVGAIAEAAPKLFSPVSAEYTPLSLVLILLAVVVKYIFSQHARHVGKKIGSASLVATGIDAFFDALSSFSTLVAALANLFFSVNLEGFFGVIIGAFIIRTSVEILVGSAKRFQKSRSRHNKPSPRRR